MADYLHSPTLCFSDFAFVYSTLTIGRKLTRLSMSPCIQSPDSIPLYQPDHAPVTPPTLNSPRNLGEHPDWDY